MTRTIRRAIAQARSAAQRASALARAADHELWLLELRLDRPGVELRAKAHHATLRRREPAVTYFGPEVRA